MHSQALMQLWCEKNSGLKIKEFFSKGSKFKKSTLSFGINLSHVFLWN